MKQDERTKKWTMKTMQELMDPNVNEEDIPKNIVHLF